MKYKIKYKRIMIVGIIGIIIVGLLIYMMGHRNHFYEYNGNVETYVGTYRQNDKIYTFDLKGFQQDNVMYISLNDMYNMVVIMDKQAKVYIDQNRHALYYELSEKSYQFDYGQNKIVYNNECIDLNHKKEYIYISHKNIYISVYYIEKILLNDEKKIKIENKNAIIQ